MAEPVTSEQPSTPLRETPSQQSLGPSLSPRDLCLKWRTWLEPFVFTLYIISLIVALPLCVLVFKHEEANLRTRTWFIGGIFVFLSVPVSLHTIVQHLIHYTKPNLQRHIVRILWMPFIYAASAVGESYFWLGETQQKNQILISLKHV